MREFLNRLLPLWRPHPGQLEFLTCPSRFRVLACGRRWGKTDACAVDTLETLFRATPAKHILIAPTLDQASLLFERLHDLLLQFLEKMGWDAKPSVRRSPYPKLEFEGHRVVARSGHLARSLRGNEATDIVIDEAAFVPEELVAEVAMPMLATTNGRMTLISTPRGMNHFWRLFKKGQEGNPRFWSRHAPTSESPYVMPEFLEIQREIISERAFRVEYEAEFLDSAERIFKTEAIDSCLVSSFDSEARGPFFIGVDWGRHSDFTAVAVVSGDRLSARLVEIVSFNNLSWTVQVEKVCRIVQKYPGARVHCDGNGIGDPLFEALRSRLSGHRLEAYGFSNASKCLLIDNLAWMFESGALKMLPDPSLMRELQHFEGIESRSGVRRMEAVSGYHDDLVVALALACFNLRRGPSQGALLGDGRR